MNYKKMWKELKESLKKDLEHMEHDDLYNQDEIIVVSIIIESMENKEKTNSH